MKKEVRTRYAPSPTGFMHVGNLRTALYEYLIAKSNKGKFILRIEDTDQERLVKGAVDVIYNTLKEVGMKHDEGPDVGGKYGPYIQSQRMDLYRPIAEELVKKGKAYYCFCSKQRLESLKMDKDGQKNFTGYDRHCRNLPKDEVEKLLKSGTPYVIRQKMPLDGQTNFTDMVYGEVSTPNNELDDQILIKADGYPTYNFANVVDDHLMEITHVVRGCEYLSSMPKYNLLYEALGWEIPQYIHLPLIMGRNEDGSVSKLSKRHGATGFEDLVNDGYLPEAIINYIALLGWCPKDNREIFSLDELVENFSVDRISKSPSIFDYDKLNWFNSEYIRLKTLDEFEKISMPYFEIAGVSSLDTKKIASLLQKRISKLTEIPEAVRFLSECPQYDAELFINKKNKTNLENSKFVLQKVIAELEKCEIWDFENLHEILMNLAKSLELKNGVVMWPTRIAISGKLVTPGGAIEILEILEKEESIKRLQNGLEKLSGGKIND